MKNELRKFIQTTRWPSCVRFFYSNSRCIRVSRFIIGGVKFRIQKLLANWSSLDYTLTFILKKWSGRYYIIIKSQKNLEITETAMPRSRFDKINSGHINQFLNSQFTIFVLVKFTIYNSELSVLYTSFDIAESYQPWI